METRINLALALALGLALSACAPSPMRVGFAESRVGPTAAAVPIDSCTNDGDIGRRSAILATPLTERWRDGGC
jgi:hypothetical protein